ncbi:MAG: peptidase T [Spirochaetaceae bacterium]|nr:MAG: peptidase T [Spirochaetaceae bacterium]
MDLKIIASRLDQQQQRLEGDVLERFLRYVKIHTTSDPDNDACPSSDRQFDLARVLHQELHSLGIEDLVITKECYVLARVPGNCQVDPICFLAHMDTSPDVSGQDVKPRLWKNYDGKKLDIGNAIVLDPAENPLLARYVGQTIITTSGDTLLGADDKAGVAEIMTAIKFFVENPDIPRPPLEILFTPDEEIGRGLDGFSLDMLQSKVAYTFDGGEEGEIEAECFSAARARIAFQGVAIHPGYARGRMVNAVSMAAAFVGMLPRNESPEATDEREGYYAPVQIRGTLDVAEVEVNLRDFEADGLERRVALIEQSAETIRRQFPGGRVSVEVNNQYKNMRDAIAQNPLLMERARQAIKATGIQPLERSIRGGTDGARLTEMGVPCPNIFAGGINFHSRKEWIALPAMVRAVQTAIYLTCFWSAS